MLWSDQWSLPTYAWSDGCGRIGRVKLTCFGVNQHLTFGLVSGVVELELNEINDLQALPPRLLVPDPLCALLRRYNEWSPKPRVVGSIPASRTKINDLRGFFMAQAVVKQSFQS